MPVEFKMNRTVARKFKLGDEEKDFYFWMTQSAEVRIAGIEMLRIQHHGEAPFKQGLQRVLRVVKQ
jgi:hypothetical protein